MKKESKPTGFRVPHSCTAATPGERRTRLGADCCLTVAALTVVCVGTILLGGCATASRSSVATAPAALEKDIKKGRGAYWYSKPDVASVDCGNFDCLWNTAFNVARDDHFMIDRTDFREGLLTTQPLISKQPFEIWRDEVVDAHSMLQSALGTVRRTIQFHISREAGGGYRCVPKVLVERESLAEHRITSVTEYHDIFAVSRQLTDRDTDFGTPVILDYWYAIGRDPALEKNLAGKISAHLKSQSCDE